MRHERLLLILILSELMLIIFSAAVEFAPEPALLAKLRADVSREAAGRARMSAHLVTALWIVVALGTLLAGLDSSIISVKLDGSTSEAGWRTWS
jgi:hypothetical protein